MSLLRHSVPTTAPGVPLVPKPPGPSFQDASSKPACSQPSARLVGRVPPGLRLLLAGRHDDFGDHDRRRQEQRRVQLGHVLDVELDHFAVIGHQAVHFALAIRGLRIDGGRKSFADQRPQPPDEAVVGELNLFQILEVSVAPVLLVPPQMSRNRDPQSAELAQHRHAFVLQRRHAGAGVVVYVLHVAAALVGPAAGFVHRPRRVVLLNRGGNLRRVVLAPAFVERHPHDDAGVVPIGVDNALQFQFELRPRELGPVAEFLARPTAAGHVLPDQQAELVAVVVPARRLDLDVFASHVKAQLACHLDIEPQAPRRWRPYTSRPATSPGPAGRSGRALGCSRTAG